MELREKVIKGLECCLPPHDPDCYLCPYDSIDLRCRSKLHEDVMVLLKAQEPRLLTLKEVQQERVMWLETNNHEWDAMNGIHETVLRTDDDRYDFSDIIVQFVDQEGCDIVCARDRFGIEWRCWSSEPTEEQREAIPWESVK